MHENLKQLVSVRSYLAEHLLEYLQKLTTKLRTIEEIFPEAADVSKGVHETLVKLKTQTAPVEDLPIYVLLELNKLVRGRQRDPATAITNFLQEQFRLDASLCRWLRE